MSTILGYTIQAGLNGRPPEKHAFIDTRGILTIGVAHSRRVPIDCREASFFVDGKDEEIKIVFLPRGGTHSATRHRGQIKLTLRKSLQMNWPELLGLPQELAVDIVETPGHPDWRTATVRRKPCRS